MPEIAKRHGGDGQFMKTTTTRIGRLKQSVLQEQGN
jgi:hypothetical protein